MKAVADVERRLRRDEPGQAESRRQHEVESRGLFRDFPAEIGPEGAAGKLHIGTDLIERDKGVFDLGCKSDAMREYRFVELDVHNFCADRHLSAIPSVPDRVREGHHPGGHEGRTLLLGCVVCGEPVGKHVAGGKPDFLRPDGDRG